MWNGIVNELMTSSWMPRFGLQRYLNSFFNVVRANLDEYNLFGKTIPLNEFTALMSNNSEKNFLVTNKRYKKGKATANRNTGRRLQIYYPILKQLDHQINMVVTCQ